MQKNERPANNKNEKTVEIDVFSIVTISFVVIMGVLLLFLSFHFVKQFVPARSFEILGESPYEENELASQVGIELGDKIFRLDLHEAEARLLEKCPYLKKVEIECSLFGKVTFEVESYKPIWYIEISGDCYVLDGDMRVLEETADKERLYQSDLIYLTLPHVKSAIVGDILLFGDGEVEIEETQNIMEMILNSPSWEMICSADIDNRYDVHFEFDKIIVSENEAVKTFVELDDVFVVNVGGYAKLETKLEYIYKAILRENLDGAVGGTIDISESGDKISIRPRYES